MLVFIEKTSLGYNLKVLFVSSHILHTVTDEWKIIKNKIFNFTPKSAKYKSGFSTPADWQLIRAFSS